MSTPSLPRILIVDDEVRQMEALCATLPEYGYETAGCSSATTALARLRDEKFDLMLTDLSMPEMDGIALVQAAQKADPDLVCVVMTGHGTVGTAVEVMRAGALDYVLKPFKASVALPVLSRSLEVRRLRMENAGLQLREAERSAELSRFFSVSLDLLCIAGKDGYFKRINPAWETALGYSEETLLGSPYIEFVHPDDQDQTAIETAKLASGGYETVAFENRYRHIDGGYRWIRWTTSSSGDLIYAAARDVTEQKEMEFALREAKELAEKANLAKSEFLSRMSHELRTPLNAIMGFAQLLDLQYVDDPQIAEATRSILRGGRHLLAMINEVLDLSRIESGRLSMSIEPVALSEVLKQAIDLIQPIADGAGIQLAIEGKGFEGVHLRADRQRLLQVLINLLSNAVKYNRAGGQVRARCIEGTGENTRIEISDTGRGISTKDQALLFEPFQRFGDQRVEGTGLGLALSERFARLMEGSLGLAESSASGSTFFVELGTCPSVQRELELPTWASPVDHSLSKRTGSVLYIEDNLSNMRLLEILFAKWKNLSLIPAAEGLLGLELASEHSPNLILLDLHLPDVGGGQVLKRLKADPATESIPVVIVSADANPVQIKEMLGDGAADFLTKPLDLKQLIEVLEKHLEVAA